MCEFFDKLTKVTQAEDATFLLECLKKQNSFSAEIISLAILAGGNRNYKYTNYVTTEEASKPKYTWFKSDTHFIYRIPIGDLAPRFVLDEYNHKPRFILANFYEDMVNGEHIYFSNFMRIRKIINRQGGHVIAR